MSNSDLILQKDLLKNTKNIQTDEELIYNYAWNKFYNHFQQYSNCSSGPNELIDYKNGFSYDPHNQLFFDHTMQLYFEIDNNVFYYFKYNNISNKYHLRYHSHINLEYWKFIRQVLLNYQINNHNISNSNPSTKNELNSKISINHNKSSKLMFQKTSLNPQYPPCIRAILIQNTSESSSSSLGSLFLIPFTGGSIGKQLKTNLIDLKNEKEVGKLHASIKYDLKEEAYFVKDENSNYETFLNEIKLEPKKDYQISHGDKLKIGKHVCLLLHIHLGTNTCMNCEPGQVMHKLKQNNIDEDLNACFSKISLEENRKKTNNQLKKKYGFIWNNIDAKIGLDVSNKYNDRAKARREKFGIDTSHIDSLIESREETSIKKSNPGYKLLTKMGWSEGEGLGKSKNGITELIEATNRNQSKNGLGFEHSKSNLNEKLNATIHVNEAKTIEKVKQNDKN